MLGDEGRRAAVGREHEPAEGTGLHERSEQRAKVRAQRGLAEHEGDAQARAIERLRGGDGLMVRADPGRGKAGELLGAGAGGVSLDPLAGGGGQGQSLEQVPPPRQHVGPARHLPDGGRPGIAQHAPDCADAEAARFVLGARLAVGPDQPVELEGTAGEGRRRRLESPEPAQLVDRERVAEDRRGAERQDVTRQRRRRGEIPRMSVRLDVPGHQRPPGGVDDLGAGAHHVVSSPDIGDPLAADGHVGGMDLARVDVQEEPAPHVAVRLGGAAGHRGELHALAHPHAWNYGCRKQGGATWAIPGARPGRSGAARRISAARPGA